MTYLEQLTQRDLTDIAYDIREISIFFRDPITFSLPDRPDLQPMTVGQGLGGFSWSLFQRGADCNLCSNCCRNTHRRVWFWWSTEPHPDSVEHIRLELNGWVRDVWVHLNLVNDQAKCDFLVDSVAEDGRAIGLCGLHEAGLKPNHCRTHPQTGVYLVNTTRGKVPLLSRRLPSRNWRWPDCPIDVAKVPMSNEQFETDSKMWEVWDQNLSGVPGSLVANAREVWSRGPYGTNVFFEDAFAQLEYPQV